MTRNAAVGNKSMTEQLCLIKVLQTAILKYKYSSEWKRLFKINLITVWAVVAVVLLSANISLETWGLLAQPVETLDLKGL